MRIPRIYLPTSLTVDTTMELGTDAANHVVRVLRLKPGAALTLFNGQGGEYQAVLHSTTKNQAYVTVLKHILRETESPLHITLAQGISRGERMDYTLQKAVELGVTQIVPLFSERCEMRLQGERLDKRLRHWQGVVTSACEQCRRNRIPQVATPMAVQQWLPTSSGTGLRLVLDPLAIQSLAQLDKPDDRKITLLIGPEGGLSETEIGLAQEAGFIGIRLGPRLLRTETAGVATLAALQTLWGDLLGSP